MWRYVAVCCVPIAVCNGHVTAHIGHLAARALEAFVDDMRAAEREAEGRFPYREARTKQSYILAQPQPVPIAQQRVGT